MNEKQKLFCAISGYTANGAYASTKDDHFYELLSQCISDNRLILYLDQYSYYNCNIALTADDLKTVKNALIANIKIENENDRFNLYDNLKTTVNKIGDKIKNYYLVTLEYFDRQFENQDLLTCYTSKEKAAIFFWEQAVQSGTVLLYGSEDERMALYRYCDSSFISFYDDALENTTDGDLINCGEYEIGFKVFKK